MTDSLRVGGEMVLTYRRFDGSRPTADEASSSAPHAVVIPAILEQLGGWWFSTDDDALTDGLLAAGATMARHGHTCRRVITSRDVETSSSTSKFELAPISVSARELAELSETAYGSEHVDFDAAYDPAPELTGLFDGEILGPYLPDVSFQIIDRDRLVGAIVVNDRVGDEPDNGPWVSEVFRHPDKRYRGLGTVLLEAAIQALASKGQRSLGLVVTEGNPAAALYARLGFVRVASGRKLLIPRAA